MISKNPGCAHSLMALTVSQPVKDSTGRINTTCHTLGHPSHIKHGGSRSAASHVTCLNFWPLKQIDSGIKVCSKFGESGEANSSRGECRFSCFVCSPLSFPSKQVPETGADRWSSCVTVCLVLSERCVEGYSEPPALALGGPSLRDRERERERRSGNWAHMMFFHRHKGDLGEIQEEPRELRFCGSDGKQEEKRERATHAKEKRDRERERVKEGESERHYLYSCISSANDVMLTVGTTRE